MPRIISAEGIHPTASHHFLSNASPPVMDQAAYPIPASTLSPVPVHIHIPIPNPTLTPPHPSAIIQGNVQLFHTYPRVSRSKSDLSCKSLESEALFDGVGSPREEASDTAMTVCRCLAGASVDCAAILCCPFTLLHLLGLVCVRLPACVLSKAKGRKGWSSGSGCKVREKAMQPTLGGEDLDGKEELQSHKHLHDEEFLMNYFGCRNLGFGSFDSENPV